MRYRESRTFWAVIIPTLSIAWLLAACQQQRREPVVTASPTPAATFAVDAGRMAASDLQNPYQQYVPGLLARTVFKAEPTERFAVEMWDLLVGPGKKSDTATLPGGAVIEIRSGSGVIVVGNQRREVKIGDTFSIDEGNSFQVENSSADDALSIRAVLIRNPRS